MIKTVLIGLLGALLYVSGLLVWPICALLWRKQGRHARVLRWAFFGGLACQLVVAGFFVFSRGIFGHQYYWCIVSMMVNVLFTPPMIIAALYDHGNQSPKA
jgi:hypothetical protein